MQVILINNVKTLKPKIYLVSIVQKGSQLLLIQFLAIAEKHLGETIKEGNRHFNWKDRCSQMVVSIALTVFKDCLRIRELQVCWFSLMKTNLYLHKGFF